MKLSLDFELLGIVIKPYSHQYELTFAAFRLRFGWRCLFALAYKRDQIFLLDLFWIRIIMVGKK